MKVADVRSLSGETVLAQPVYNHQGELLFNKGTRIAQKELTILKSWGIDRIFIEEEKEEKGRQHVQEGSAVEASDTNPEQSLRQELQKQFADVLDDPFMVEIMRVAEKLHTRRQANIPWDDDDQ